MPARVSVRSSRSSAKPRVSTTDEEIPDEGPSTSLRERVCLILADVQRSNTGHRKLVVGLRKIQEACCYEPTDARKRTSTDDFDENDFNIEMVRCLLRVLTVKKSEPVGDRIVRFLGVFLKHATSLDNQIFAEDENEAQGIPETPTSRLTSQVILTLLPMLQAKDKVVRFRCTQIIAHLINVLDSIDDELFNHIRLGLLKRLRDKESNVRVQAVCGLGRLAGEALDEQDPEDSDDDTAGAVLNKLLDVLQHDSSPEVRKSLLLNLPFTPSTLPYLLERARDLDSGIRRALYARLLPALGDFRHLSLTHREKLLRWGLRDRDENVSKATGRLFRDRWIEDCARPRDENGDPIDLKPGQVADPSFDALLELLERIDVVNAGNDGGIALDAMKEFWGGRPDYRDHIEFDEAFWKSLTPESVFVARTFNDYCRQDGVSESLSEKLPEVTRLAFLLQSSINSLAELIQRIAVEEDAEEDSVHQEFIVEQLLHIALTLDYSDEVGRRTMFGLMREALTLAELPEEATRLVVEVLKMSCGTGTGAEREFCSVVLEAIAEVHDTIMFEEPPKEDNNDDSFVSARSEVSEDSEALRPKDQDMDEEKAVKEIMVNMKCLHIAQCMLQNVEADLENNSDLVTMLNNLVVPAVRSQEAPIRERGLLCLGLCCLLDRNLAEENLTLFLHCFSKGHEQLQSIAIQIVGDILITRPSLLITAPPTASEGDRASEQASTLDKPIHKLFSKSLKSGSMQVQSTACAALSKLMLSSPAPKADGNESILRISELLKLLVVAYFDPETADNSALRQALSYFLPVYCHSRQENMQCMSSIALEVLHWYLNLKEELDVDGEDEADSELVSLQVVVNHIIDWTDGRRLALARTSVSGEEKPVDCNAHLDLAERTLDKMLGQCSREERKLCLSILGKLHITSDTPDTTKVQMVLRLVDDAIEDKVAGDVASRGALVKIQSTLAKIVASREDAARSQDASRAPSTGPSSNLDVNEGELESTSVAGAIEAVNGITLNSTATTPATSPRKRSSRQSPARAQKSSQVVYQDADDEGDISMAESIAATPTASPVKGSMSRRTTSANYGSGNASATLEQENIPPSSEMIPAASPQKNRRGRPTSMKSTENGNLHHANDAGADDDTGDAQVKIEDETIGNVKVPPPKKPRGRPPRGTGAASQPRRSIRAGRRKTPEETGQ